MKKFLTSLLSIIIGGAVVVIIFLSLATQSGVKYIQRGNIDKKPLVIKAKEYQCSECNMDIEDMGYLVELIRDDGVTYFFDDIGCLILWQKNHSFENTKIIAKTLDTKEWIDIKACWYSRVDNTPMGYGFAPYKIKKDKLIPYEEMKLLMLQGKTLHDPFVKKSILED
jgi:hypothetical protein